MYAPAGNPRRSKIRRKTPEVIDGRAARRLAFLTAAPDERTLIFSDNFFAPNSPLPSRRQPQKHAQWARGNLPPEASELALSENSSPQISRPGGSDSVHRRDINGTGSSPLRFRGERRFRGPGHNAHLVSHDRSGIESAADRRCVECGRRSDGFERHLRSAGADPRGGSSLRLRSNGDVAIGRAEHGNGDRDGHDDRVGFDRWRLFIFHGRQPGHAARSVRERRRNGLDAFRNGSERSRTDRDRYARPGMLRSISGPGCGSNPAVEPD